MSTPLLSLDHRIGLVRRRRRIRIFKQLAVVVGPVLGGVVFILLLAVVGAVSASAR
jgi:hypothetical protein